MFEQNKHTEFRDFFNTLFRRNARGFGVERPPRLTRPEESGKKQEIVPGKWYRAFWNGLEGIAQMVPDKTGENKGEYEFHLKLPDEADQNTVTIDQLVDNNDEGFYSVSYRIIGKRRGEIIEVFWWTQDGNYCRRFGWYIGPEFEEEKGVVNHYRQTEPIEL